MNNQRNPRKKIPLSKDPSNHHLSIDSKKSTLDSSFISSFKKDNNNTISTDGDNNDKLNFAYPSLSSVNNNDKINISDNSNRVNSSNGPIRDTSKVDRMVCRFDYAQDLCKDYNETGYCGFGDSCIFLHDRGDYKSGWELDQEFSNRSLNHQTSFVISKSIDLPLFPTNFNSGSNEEKLQIDCEICQIEWKPNTRVCKIKCGHEFCESCTLREARKKCPICHQPTNDQFKFVKK